MKLLVGIGNPGEKYRNTRHNFGFALLDTLADLWQCSFAEQNKFRGEISFKQDSQHDKIILLKPQTFMNLSGESVIAVAQFYKLSPSDILLMHDELDLPLGTLRFVKDGGSAGHNGLKSIIQHLGTTSFARLKLGIGRPKHPGLSPADFVLQKFLPEETPIVAAALKRASEGVESFLQKGLEATCNVFNRQSTLVP